MKVMSSAAAPALVPGGTVQLSRLGDERLARLIAAGSERAFAELYGRYHQQLYRYARSIVLDDADAQDVLQSTFTAALSALQQHKRAAPLRPWLFRIAHNEAISVVRRRRGGAAELPALEAASVEEQADERARLALLIADLRELPERRRSALVLRELNGLSHQEIAIVLGTSVGAAKQAIFDARRALMELEEGRAMACEDVRRILSDGDGRVLRGRRVSAHLRDCGGCAAFAAAIPARRGDLRALAPALPPTASAALLARAIQGVSGHGVLAGAGDTTAAATACAAGKTVAAAVGSKALATAAAVAIVAAGVGGVAVVERIVPHRTGRSTAARSGQTALAGAHGRGGGLLGTRAGGASGGATTGGFTAFSTSHRGATSRAAHGGGRPVGEPIARPGRSGRGVAGTRRQGAAHAGGRHHLRAPHAAHRRTVPRASHALAPPHPRRAHASHPQADPPAKPRRSSH
jgi:RNA polymerase sigma factor (sigma-70 family)